MTVSKSVCSCSCGGSSGYTCVFIGVSPDATLSMRGPSCGVWRCRMASFQVLGNGPWAGPKARRDHQHLKSRELKGTETALDLPKPLSTTPYKPYNMYIERYQATGFSKRSVQEWHVGRMRISRLSAD